ncbi:hypothetical protein BACCOP_04081 [Phocaeicola coprocola DSM 17136]|uniref:Uncharacterized protein n=1 Tax=Phocaeicola coprocola DSM 17136 TaxID=470145 RepID=B3JQB7_9BACT|nr:hypothetical protein BACCOP_04081 [Phocaeicola coprocola DSM 17136]
MSIKSIKLVYFPHQHILKIFIKQNEILISTSLVTIRIAFQYFSTV